MLYPWKCAHICSPQSYNLISDVRSVPTARRFGQNPTVGHTLLIDLRISLRAEFGHNYAHILCPTLRTDQRCRLDFRFQ